MKIKVGNKELTISKWKGKTKKDFLTLLKVPEKDEKALMETLVYSCIEEDVVLSADEFRYVHSRIRALSLGEEFDVEFYCDECQSTFTRTLLLKDIIRYSYKDLKEINVPGVKIKLCEIKNKQAYLDKIDIDPEYDFLFRIESINGYDAFTFAELEELIEDLDIDVLEQVMEIYEDARFKVLDINTVKCDCGHEMTFQFDELPGFFPKTWFE